MFLYQKELLLSKKYVEQSHRLMFFRFFFVFRKIEENCRLFGTWVGGWGVSETLLN